jgi:hypothetical protein
MSPVKYELGFYVPEDGILHSHCRENHRSYMLKNCAPLGMQHLKQLRLYI